MVLSSVGIIIAVSEQFLYDHSYIDKHHYRNSPI